METYPTLTTQSYADVRNQIRSGDLLLCSGTSTFSKLIQQATNSIWSHVGFILRMDHINRILVLESVESIGVRIVPLSSYVNDYNGTEQTYPGRLMIARHDDVKQESIGKLSRTAIDLCGHPYGKDEIARIVTRISMSKIGLMVKSETHQDPLREFICSEFAHVCLESIGITVNYNALGYIAPADFIRDPKVTPLCYIENAVNFVKNVREPIHSTA